MDRVGDDLGDRSRLGEDLSHDDLIERGPDKRKRYTRNYGLPN
jgi:hypothetical protein